MTEIPTTEHKPNKAQASHEAAQAAFDKARAEQQRMEAQIAAELARVEANLIALRLRQEAACQAELAEKVKAEPWRQALQKFAQAQA